MRNQAIVTMIICLIVGCVLILFFAFQTWNLTQIWSIMGIGVMIAGSSFLSGGLLGFLFGIPKTLQQNRTEATSPNEKKPGDNAASYQANTNLEQISDWLTKILVGVGLTQITSLPEIMQRYADFVGPALGNLPTSKVFAIALLVFFLIDGFLISYLWTRLYFAGELRQADLATLKDDIIQVRNKQNESDIQADKDTKAIRIVQQQLNIDGPAISQQDLNEAIKSASSNVKAQIFYLAQTARRDDWQQQDKANRVKTERTIPIFRALVASDKDDLYHANHGQLGFALVDQSNPNWAEAESELTKAIQIRDKKKESGWQFYEYNRAICRINQDDAYKKGQSSDETHKKAIIDDLKKAAKISFVKNLIKNDLTKKELLDKWSRLNRIDLIQEI